MAQALAIEAGLPAGPRGRRGMSDVVATGLAAGLALLAAAIHGRGVLEGRWWQAGTLLFYGLIFVLFLCRRPSLESSKSLRHWMMALGGTFLPFLAIPTGSPHSALLWVSLPIQGLGMALALLAVTTLGRSFGVIAAQRLIKTHGPYGWVRHPLYLGEAIWFFSIVLQHLSLFNALLFLLQVSCQLRRIVAEEALLARDASYSGYCRAVPYRLIPRLY